MSGFAIESLSAREILNSRGHPALEVEAQLGCGAHAVARVPSGASKGENEALELVDGDPSRFGGKGLLRAVANVHNKIAKALTGMDASDQFAIDQAMIALDGTVNKSALGANATLGVSLAVFGAFCNASGFDMYQRFARLINSSGDELRYHPPMPMINVINGGLHADNGLAIQEFMLAPHGYKTFRACVEDCAVVFYRLKNMLKAKGHSTNVGDEGGFAPSFSDTREALDILSAAIGEKSGSIKIALDSAASTFYENGFYCLDGKKLTPEEMLDFYQKLSRDYPISSIEDPFTESDHASWKGITDELGGSVSIVGDDLFVTNPLILKEGIKAGLANSVLIKMNQIGTITETIDAIKIAKGAGYSVVISHRSGETEDTAIADLAVACGAGTRIKAGSFARSERVAKYNRILRIEDILSGH